MDELAALPTAIVAPWDRPAFRLARRLKERLRPTKPTAWSPRACSLSPADARTAAGHHHRLRAPGTGIATEACRAGRDEDEIRSGCRASPRSGATRFDLDMTELANSATATRPPPTSPTMVADECNSIQELFAATACRRSTKRRWAASRDRYVSALKADEPTDADSWDVASSAVRRTMVAAARARASKEPNPLIDEPCGAAGASGGYRLLHQAWRRRDRAVGRNVSTATLMTTVMAVRTKFFDDFFLGATRRASGRRHPGLGSGTRGHPAALAGRHRRLRDRQPR